MSSPSSQICRTCGLEIPFWAVSGSCPKCLLGGGSGDADTEENSKRNQEIVEGWSLGELIGEGAFGVVYKVSQTTPMKRSGAMKILRPAMCSNESLARFDVEREALAMLNHEGIVTIFDAGKTADGRPFFVMEFVDGIPVTELAAGLKLEEKLALFEKISSVVTHAHLHGMIHRDLKPANILALRGADGEPTVKLLDFGIAKATESVMTGRTLMTTEGQLLGTPDYMSPEQAAGEEVDSRADVYSLGVILFELLAGRPPFVLEGNSLEAVFGFLKSVREDTPPNPSDLADELIPADLNWIVGKALEKEPERRYQSVRELCDDLERFAENQPVKARPPDQIYILKKFLRRHWKMATLFVGSTAVIVVAAVISTVMGIRAQEASLETAAAYSRSDFDLAVQALDQNRISASVRSLHRALTVQPSNREAALLLDSVVRYFPEPELVSEEVLHERGVTRGRVLDFEKDTALFVAEGNLQWTDDRGKSLRIGGSHYNPLAFSMRDLLAVGSLQGSLSLVDLKTRTLRAPDLLPGNRQRFTSLRFADDGRRLFAATRDVAVHAWDGETGELEWQIKPASRPLALVSDPEGRFLIAGLQNGMLEKRSASTGEKIDEARVTGEVLELLRHNPAEVFVFHGNGAVTLCDFKSLSPRRLPITWEGEFQTAKLRPDPTSANSSKTLAIGTDDGILLLKISDRSQVYFPTNSPVVEIAFHPTRDVVAVGTESSGIQLFDFAASRIIAADIEDSENPVYLDFSPNGKHLNLITRRGIKRVYRLPPGRETTTSTLSGEDSIRNLPASIREIPREARNFELQTVAGIDWPKEISDNPIPPVAAALGGDFFADSRREPENALFITNLTTGETITKLASVPRTFIRYVDITDEGKWMTWSSSHGEARVMDLSTGETKPFKLKHPRSVSCVTFDSSGEKLATATFGCSIWVFDAKTGQLIAGPMFHDSFGELTRHYCRFSADGMRLVSWGQTDNRFRVWNSATGEAVSPGLKMPGLARFARFHPEIDEFLFTVSENESGGYSARLWIAEIGVPVTPIVNFLHFPTVNDLPLPKDSGSLETKEEATE